MSKPVIFLAFANDRDDYLPMINRERKNIFRTLREHHDNDFVQVNAEAGATLEDIFEFINAYHNQLAIFHYGGHAGVSSLRLEQEDTSAADASAKGLAQLLGMEENLQLVFLNGCATKPQVKILLENGVKAVIATSVPIQDQMATEFAEQFYLAMASGASIERAFQVATAFIGSKYNYTEGIKTYRSIELLDETEESEIPWGLYINEEKNSSPDWKLPNRTNKANILQTRFDYESKIDVNDILIDIICEDIAQYNKDLDDELNKDELDIPSIRREIVDSFPTPIGEHLRKLFTRSNDPSSPDDMEQFTLARLEQLGLTYFTTFQFTAFILLSQLWDERFNNNKLDIGEDHILELNSFFGQTPENYKTFSYPRLIRSLMTIFENKKVAYFIKELNQLERETIQEDSEFFQACVFMQALQEELVKKAISKDKIEELCLEAENQLGIILKNLAFLVKYKLVTIKNIELVKNRHETARYLHSQITLNKALTVASTGIAEVGIEFENFTDNKSVLFLKLNDDKVEGFLNLTPFVIDENALNKDYSSKLFLFIYQANDNCYYQFLNNSEDPPYKVSEDNFPMIEEQYNRFKAEIFGKTYTPQVRKKRIIRGSRFSKKR